ncbi:hypothetical protein DFO67_13515 [Modicisalibacter xianhensis]|uniref:Uncharacterized protein n=1 Tax=Modicisalibacter xianhensis TaxID=442341 RepID=A0A4R8FDR2_9GAMM|nr:hypothetical protein DFO67_13515 [Halomonas xianhensis]
MADQVYAVSPRDLYGGDIMAGKMYSVTKDDGDLFSITDDSGCELRCRWEEGGCAHLDYDGQWQRVEDEQQ